jgi:hypothetical protein
MNVAHSRAISATSATGASFAIWYRLRQISEYQRRSNSPRPVTIEIVNAAIIVLLILLATGVVVSPLLRLRAWLKRSPPGQEFQPPPDEDAE